MPSHSPSPSRRDLLMAFLGAGAVQAGCRKRRLLVPGALVDDAAAVGHRLRGPLNARDGAVRSVDVLIAGAGVAGLSAAWRLAGAGLSDIVVCELEAAEGGTAQSGASAVTAFPWGAHYLPAPLEAAGPVARLLSQLGVLEGTQPDGRAHYAEQALVHEPEERLYFRGSWYEGLYLRPGASEQDLSELRRFEARMDAFAAAYDDRGRKAFAVPTADSSDDERFTALDRLSMAQWLAREGFSSSRLGWVVDYACRDDFGATAENVSAWAAIWYFAARHGGESRRAPGYLTWPGGNGHLVRGLSASLAPERRLRSTLVHSVEPGPNGCRVEAVDARDGRPMSFLARHVVLACPRFIAARVLAPWRAAPPPFLSAFTYAPWVVANLHLSSPPEARGFPLAWDNVLYESRSLGYVVATHQAERAVDPGPTVLTWYYPLTGEPGAERTRLLSTSYEDWEAVVMADLLPAHVGLERQCTRLEVRRWGHAMVRPAPGFLTDARRLTAAAPVDRRVHFAHTDLSGMALFEEAMHHGVRAAEEVLASLGKPGPSWR